MQSSALSKRPERLPWALRNVGDERFVAGNRIRLLHDGREAFPAMLDAIAGARAQVLLEMYWFDSNRIGQRFASALRDALRRGVEVAVIFDSVGSIGADPAMFVELAAAGAHVLEFNPVAPWKRRFRLSRLTRRDHRKILVVDGTIGFTGGINIGDQWLPEEEEGGGWRDDMALVEGPAARGFVQCFLSTWRRMGGPTLRVSANDEAFAAPSSRSAEQGPSSGQKVRVISESGYRRRHAISRAYLARIYRAEQRVWISNSYFVPDRSVIRAITRAARRGVDVRILLPDESDVKVADWASRAVWAKLMRRGVRIFTWTRGILHSKTAVIDGRWSTIGTFNMDHLSLRSNLEVNVTVLDEGFGETMEAAFARDLARAVEVDRRTFSYRPLGERILEMLAYWGRKLL
jgi:cardiolipin synthase